MILFKRLVPFFTYISEIFYLRYELIIATFLHFINVKVYVFSRLVWLKLRYILLLKYLWVR